MQGERCWHDTWWPTLLRPLLVFSCYRSLAAWDGSLWTKWASSLRTPSNIFFYVWKCLLWRTFSNSTWFASLPFHLFSLFEGFLRGHVGAAHVLGWLIGWCLCSAVGVSWRWLSLAHCASCRKALIMMRLPFVFNSISECHTVVLFIGHIFLSTM